eukprot:TRINITY_DN5124_c0_g1_i1.p1 TRINITY_DN5124_c0_g1~~TRINITY_DN5124_c0_g1_i1.p1  ORF type:complete len:293 (+),score=63.75 TRINITY_DN5124_c0_g1_i1:50-880(+)
MPTTNANWHEDDADTTTNEQKTTPVGALPEGETIMVDNKTKKEISYIRNSDGQTVKITRTFRVEKMEEDVSEAVLSRRKWAKYGAAANVSKLEASTTSVAEDVFLVLRSKPEEEQDEEKKPAGPVKAVVCRHCGGDHWTTKCPHKDKDFGSVGAGPNLAAANDEPTEERQSGAYVPVHQRNKGGRGATMERDDSTSIRITNLGEDTVEEDLKALCKPFGPVMRVYLAKDQETGLARGFAFVNFVSRRDAEKAIEKLNGHGFGHLILHVEWSKPNSK